VEAELSGDYFLTVLKGSCGIRISDSRSSVSYVNEPYLYHIDYIHIHTYTQWHQHSIYSLQVGLDSIRIGSRRI
jgi:hypothetical protein